MNAHQTRLVAARAAYASARAAAFASYPAEPTTTDLDSPEWDAFFDAQEDIDESTGLNAARTELYAAERALLEWGSTTPAWRQVGIAVETLRRFPDLTERALGILLRI